MSRPIAPHLLPRLPPMLKAMSFAIAPRPTNRLRRSRRKSGGLGWSGRKSRYDVSFRDRAWRCTSRSRTRHWCCAAVLARGTFELAAMAKLAHLAGSLVAVLAIVEQAGTPEAILGNGMS